MLKAQCYGCHEYGKYKRYFPQLKNDNNKRGMEESHITKEVKKLKRINPRRK